MTRADLILRLSKELGHLPIKQVEDLVKCLLDRMILSLKENDRIEIRGFGSFSKTYRASRLARNPKTGESVQTKERYSIHFKPGKGLREKVNKQ